MLEVLLVPLVTAGAKRLIKALVTDGGDDQLAGDVGALAGALAGSLVGRRHETAAAIAALAEQVAEVRRTQWHGPYSAAMDNLERAGRPEMSLSDRSDHLRLARERFGDAKGAAPEDPSILAALEVCYALVWLAEGRPSLAKGELNRASRRLEEALLTTQPEARREVQSWAQAGRDSARRSELASAVDYFLGPRGSHVHPADPGSSYGRLRALLDDHMRLRPLLVDLWATGDPFPVTFKALNRDAFGRGQEWLTLDLPRHVTTSVAGVVTTASLAPHGPHRLADVEVANDRQEPVTVRVDAVSELAAEGLPGRGTLLGPGETLTRSGATGVALNADQTLVIEVEVTRAAGPSGFRVAFPPDEDPLNTLSFTDYRALEAAKARGRAT